MAKMGMSMTTLGLAAHLAEEGVAVIALAQNGDRYCSNCNNFPPELVKASRKPSIVADAAYAILMKRM